MKNIIISIVIIGIIGGAYYFGTKQNSTQSVKEVVTVATTTVETPQVTPSVKVVETPKVVEKPAVKVVQPSTNTTIKIGQRVAINGLHVTPGKVTYDSRCPRDVQCVQAGTVELGVLLEGKTSTQNVIITLNKTFSFEGKKVTLVSVTPSKVSTKAIQESEYRFSITVK
jgi:hypothetical protein